MGVLGPKYFTICPEWPSVPLQPFSLETLTTQQKVVLLSIATRKCDKRSTRSPANLALRRDVGARVLPATLYASVPDSGRTWVPGP